MDLLAATRTAPSPHWTTWRSSAACRASSAWTAQGLAGVVRGEDRRDPRLLRNRRRQYVAPVPALPAHARRVDRRRLRQGNRAVPRVPRRAEGSALAGIRRRLEIVNWDRVHLPVVWANEPDPFICGVRPVSTPSGRASGRSARRRRRRCPHPRGRGIRPPRARRPGGPASGRSGCAPAGSRAHACARPAHLPRRGRCRARSRTRSPGSSRPRSAGRDELLGAPVAPVQGRAEKRSSAAAMGLPSRSAITSRTLSGMRAASMPKNSRLR